MNMLSAAVLAGSLVLPFSPAEIERIGSHGPWPPPSPVGRPALVALGERLFASPSLSGTGGVACASCHAPWRRFTDGRALAFGLQTGERNTPTLLNVAQQHRFGWDGASDSLWKQSLRPLHDTREMRSSAAHVAGVVRADADLQAMYRAAFEADPPVDAEQLLTELAKALAAYQQTLTSERTPFDAFRDALVSGDRGSAATYPPAAQRGLRLFVGKAACATCHAGPLFSDGRLHRTRLGGDRAWRTPGLRDVAATGPYMHDGSVPRLCDTSRPHAGRVPAARLTRAEQADLLAFLKTLGEAEPPFADPASLRCRPLQR